MTPGLRIALSVLMLFGALICLYGFIATFEPPGWIVFRIVYVAAGLLLLTGCIAVLPRRPKPLS